MLFTLFIFILNQKFSESAIANKCCPPNQVLKLSEFQCTDANVPVAIQNKFLHLTKEFDLTVTKNESFFPYCKEHEVLINRPIYYFQQNHKLLKKLNQYCFDISAEDKFVLVGCIPVKNRAHFPGKKIALRKCCPMGEAAYSPDTPCKASPAVFKPDFYDIKNTSVLLDVQTSEFDIITPGCSDRYLPSDEDDEYTYLLENGSVWFPSSKEQNIFKSDEYCLENTPIHETTQIFLCFKKLEEAEASWEHLISGIGIVISISFLIATFIVYATDRKKRHFYGQTLMCHIASFTAAFICLVAAKIFQRPDGDVANSLIAYTMYYSFVAGFFWQNVMCIDLWRTFRAIRSRDCHSKGNKVFRFVFYSGYAWGSSAVLTSLVIYLGQCDLVPDEYRPTLRSSWLDRYKYGYYIFFITPIATIIAVNIALYIVTARRCYLVKAEIGKRLKCSDGKGKSRFFRKKEQLSLSAKLFVVMGMTWSLEVISFILKNKLQLSPYIFLLSDAMNTLYGLLIFLIFVIRKQMVISAARRLSSPRSWIIKRNGNGSQLQGGALSSCMQQSTADSAYSSTHVTDVDT